MSKIINFNILNIYKLNYIFRNYYFITIITIFFFRRIGL